MSRLVLAQLRYVYSRNPGVFSPAGPYASRIAHLGEAMIAIAAVILAAVIVIMLAGLWRRRGDIRDGDEPAPEVNARAWVLGGGMLMPIVVLGGVFIGAVAVLGATNHEERPVIDVEVVGHQWWWEVRYPRYGLTSADELHIPVGQPIRLHLTSADVIHSFWVSQLNGKTDLNPADENIMFIEADSAGVYAGRCAEYCGMQHAHMGFSVVAESEGSWLAWLQQSRSAAHQPVDSVQAAGLQAFMNNGCNFCHAIRGTPASGNVAPDLTHFGARLTIGGATVANTPANLGGWIVNPSQIKPGTKMPAVPMDGGSVNAIVQYLESLK